MLQASLGTYYTTAICNCTGVESDPAFNICLNRMPQEGNHLSLSEYHQSQPLDTLKGLNCRSSRATAMQALYYRTCEKCDQCCYSVQPVNYSQLPPMSDYCLRA